MRENIGIKWDENVGIPQGVGLSATMIALRYIIPLLSLMRHRRNITSHTRKMMNKFEEYLYSKGYRINTVNGYSSILQRIEKWCITKAILLVHICYNELLAYLNYCNDKGMKKHSINQEITALKHYFNYLNKTGQRTDNPALGIRIKNVLKTIPQNQIEYERLEALFHHYPDAGIAGKRNKMILGILIYQGARTGEIAAIEITDLDLQKAVIYIPAQRRSNGRMMPLNTLQLLGFQNYIMHIRPALLAMSKTNSDRLFISTGSSGNLNSCFSHLLKAIKQLNPMILHLEQIRTSVITYWLKTHHLREVQYMAGHKYVSSTEHYRQDHLENLLEDLERYDPLK